jgi:hypothetical protein
MFRWVFKAGIDGCPKKKEFNWEDHLLSVYRDDTYATKHKSLSVRDFLIIFIKWRVELHGHSRCYWYYSTIYDYPLIQGLSIAIQMIILEISIQLLNNI